MLRFFLHKRIIVTSALAMAPLFWPARPFEIESLQITSEEGYLLQEFRSQSSGSFQHQSQFPERLQELLLLAEDRYFYYHPGFNPLSMGRASLQNLKLGQIVSGASSLTQQLARLRWPGEYPALVRKWLELSLAVYLELHFSKDELLEAYLNQIPLRGNNQGFAAAAGYLFGRNLAYLSDAELAALVVLARQSQARPSAFQQRLKNLLRAANIPIRNSELQEISTRIFQNKSARASLTLHSAHFTGWLKQMHPNITGQIRSTLSAELQEKTRAIIQNELAILKPYAVEQAAAVILKIEADRLRLLALVGSHDFSGPQGQVNGALAVRQAGSTLKPFLYAMAMDRIGLRPYSMLDDSDVNISLRGALIYSPKNYDLNTWGRISARDALATSRNNPAVALLERIGQGEFYMLLKTLAITEKLSGADESGPGMILGAGGARLFHLAHAYSIFATRGRWFPVHLGKSAGQELFIGQKRRVLSENAALFITSILSDRNARSRSFRRRSFLDFPFPIAAKTGTSKDFKDAWTVGYSPEYVVAVWAGNFSGQPMNHVSGVYGAGRMFQQIMRVVNQNGRSFPYKNWKNAAICSRTGLLSSPSCPTREELLPPGDALPPPCSALHSRESDQKTDPDVGQTIRIRSPLRGGQYVLDVHQDQESQQIPVEILAPGQSLCLFLNDRARDCFKDSIKTTWLLERGSYALQIKSGGQARASLAFTVQ